MRHLWGSNNDNCAVSFNPRTPCGVRHSVDRVEDPDPEFQSTHSLRSATCKVYENIRPSKVSIHALLAECDGLKMYDIEQVLRVSIHALLAECDSNRDRYKLFTVRFNPRTPCGVRLMESNPPVWTIKFQSTHSLRSATIANYEKEGFTKVSIHALLAECDHCSSIPYLPSPCFNPRTPCGVRLRLTIYIVIQQRKRYFAPTSRRRPSSPSLLF